MRGLVAALSLAASCQAAQPSAADTWAVLVAGSAGYSNYRHQADVCHAYHVMKSHGVPEDQIIVMAVDDIANSGENPFKGKVFNKPGDNPTDVYDGCKITYKAGDVTPKTMINVLTGVQDGPTAGKPVLKSTSKSRVFVNFVDHGGPGIIGFPETMMHVTELTDALKTMQQKKNYGELLFYLEACESGSMFPQLGEDSKIFAVTAANARESSWGTYCMPQDIVQGKHMGTCLGDLFSVSWMENADLNQPMETIAQQVTQVTKLTNKSHVMTFGDKSFNSEKITDFGDLEFSSERLKEASPLSESLVSVRDIELRIAEFKYFIAEGTVAREFAWWWLQTVRANRKNDDDFFAKILEEACAESNEYGCATRIQKSDSELKDIECHKLLVQTVENECVTHSNGYDYQIGGWNGYSMQYSQWLVNVCEEKESVRRTTEELGQIVKDVCQKSNALKRPAEFVV